MSAFQRSISSAPAGPTPLVLSPKRLFALGASLPLDGSLSWAPAVVGRFQFVNAYLLLENGRALLVDSGVAAHEATILAQLEQVVPAGTRLTVFLTRAEMDCMANLGAIARQFDVDGVMTGGSMNPFDAFDDVPLAGTPGQHFGLERTDRGGLAMERTKTISLGPERELIVITPVFRLLSTFWLFDRATKTLFTSDLFGHTDSGAELERIVGPEDRSSTPESVAAHVLSKYWWLKGADPSRLIADVRNIFDEYAPVTIAPTHGCLIDGPDAVARHVDLLIHVLRASARGD